MTEQVSIYSGVVEFREEYARLRARQAEAVTLRQKLAETHRAVARVQRNYQAVADRKDGAWSRVLRASELLLELRDLENQLGRLSPVASLPYRASLALIPQLASQAHSLLLKDETSRRIAGHYSSDAYAMAGIILKMAGKLPTKRGKRTGRPRIRGR